MTDWLSNLASAGATAFVGAASTDAWQTARERFVQLLGRGDADRSRTASRRLDALRQTARAPGSDRDLAEARSTWRARLQDLLDEHASAAEELRSVIAALPRPGSGATTEYQQHGHATGHGRVFMNQHGNQNIHHQPDTLHG
ncbi:hypothetical protein ABZV31_32305 [Streptomyces sp. NPDC005202]|uniref:hypothetical protein n=1 Tax=Streptomyces sp. NPDC005202 TaxID=3157021 RepID=UPI0033B10387